MFVQSRARLAEFLIVALLFCATVSYFHIDSPEKNLMLYKDRWAPVLAFTCTGSLGKPDLAGLSGEERIAASTKIAEFFKVGGPKTFDCRDWSDEIKVLPMSEYDNHNRKFYRNQVGLYYLVGSVWKITGPSWEAVSWLAAVFGGLTALALYALSRAFVGVITALLLTSVVFWGPNFSGVLPFVRDFSKVPITYLGLLLLTLIIVRPSTSLKSFWSKCFILGAYFGVGVSFRQDMESLALLSVICILLFPPRQMVEAYGALWKSYLANISSAAAFLLSFGSLVVLLYWYVPVEHGPEGHFFSLGFAQEVFDRIGLDTSPFVFNPLYMDYQSYMLIRAYASAVTGIENVRVFSQEYNHYAIVSGLEHLWTFSQFTVTRIYSIAYDILTLNLFEMGNVKYLNLVVSLAALALMHTYSRRLFWFVVTVFLFLSAVLSIQYMPRHYFHIQILWFCLSASVLLGWVLDRALSQRLFWSTPKGVALFGAGFGLLKPDRIKASVPFPTMVAIVAGSITIFVTAYSMGNYNSNKWISNALKQPTLLAQMSKEVGEKTVVYRLQPYSELVNFIGRKVTIASAIDRPDYHTAAGGLMEIRFKPGEQCSRSAASFVVYYKYKVPPAQLNHQIKLMLQPDRSTSQFFPLFFSQWASVDTISVPIRDYPCIESFHWVENFPKIKLPVIFTAAR